MIPTDKFRGEFTLPLRTTKEAALVDLNLLVKVLEKYAPELIGKKVGRPVPGAAARNVRTP